MPWRNNMPRMFGYFGSHSLVISKRHHAVDILVRRPVYTATFFMINFSVLIFRASLAFWICMAENKMFVPRLKVNYIHRLLILLVQFDKTNKTQLNGQFIFMLIPWPNKESHKQQRRQPVVSTNILSVSCVFRTRLNIDAITALKGDFVPGVYWQYQVDWGRGICSEGRQTDRQTDRQREESRGGRRGRGRGRERERERGERERGGGGERES